MLPTARAAAACCGPAARQAAAGGPRQAAGRGGRRRRGDHAELLRPLVEAAAPQQRLILGAAAAAAVAPQSLAQRPWPLPTAARRRPAPAGPQRRLASSAAPHQATEVALGRDAQGQEVRLAVRGGRLYWHAGEAEPHEVVQLVFAEDTAVLSVPDTALSVELPIPKEVAPPARLQPAEQAERDAALSRIADVVYQTKGEWKVSIGWLPRGLYDRYIRTREEREDERRRELMRRHASTAPAAGGAASSSGGFEDLTEFFERHQPQMAKAKARAEEDDDPTKSFADYGRSFAGWVGKKAARVKEWASRSPEERAERKRKKKADQSANRSRSDAALQSYYQTQELCNLMKFKAVSFDDGRDPDVPAADFANWSRLIINNYSILKRCSAFSNMSFHVRRDPSKIDTSLDPTQTATNYKDVDEGTLTDWMTEEGADKGKAAAEAAAAAAAAANKEGKAETQKGPRPPPFSVDYATGEVTVLDTCSPEEFLDFLEREAPRAELRQQQIVEEQERMYEELGKAMQATGIKRFVFNKGMATVIDKDYKKLAKEGRSGEYILPADVFRFVEELMRTPQLYKRYLKGQVVRILPTQPCRAYFIDTEGGEVCLPKDFWRDTFLPVHQRYRMLAKVRRFIWSLRFLATLVFVTFLGDVDWPAVWPFTWEVTMD
eukprot:TRINITY_DN47013_c0_g1_i1.p1 TRINITY_DN47013_c0_g1~~TRINITY_DN47013_c0_g1_i1.p1  ORF type:complete len:662 (+),score=282.50 TRINITY_DN47013_c0_g1_i1:80-2065(+)